MLVEEVLQEAEDLCCHPFGHHVAQSVLEHGSDEHREIVSATIDRNPLGYARNQNASYLVERVLASNSRLDSTNLFMFYQWSIRFLGSQMVGLSILGIVWGTPSCGYWD